MANALTAALAEPRVTDNGPETLAGMAEAWDPSHWRETPSTLIFQKTLGECECTLEGRVAGLIIQPLADVRRRI